MEFLEDVLKRYGITADYWPDEESVRAPEGRVNKDALQHSMLAGADPGEVQEVGQRVLASERMLPLGMILGDIRSESGQSHAAVTAYEAAVLMEDEPEALCELGYLLLQRCRVKHLPLSDKDFEGSIDFDGETVFVSSHLIDPDNQGPEFPDKGALLPLAIRAFGIAYVRCVEKCFTEEGATWGDKWRELVALDGLRAAFIEDDNLDGLEAAAAAYCGWADPWTALACVTAKKLGHTCTVTVEGEIQPDPEDLFYRFDLNFRDAEVYLRVRPKRPPSGEPDVMAKLKELERQLREKPQQADSLLKRMAQNLGTTPNSITEPSEKALARAYGDMWVGLPPEVRRLLVQAQFFSSFLHQVAHDDWSAVVNDYARALETLLRRRLGRKLDDKGLRPKRNKSFARATIGEFCELFQRPQFAQLAPAVGLSGSSLMAEMASDICTVANWRNPADHGAQVTSPATAIKLRGLLLGTPEQRVGLLWKINSL